ncbi:hypothetical protein J1N35_012312 [Gossypium stocksii]|uniref:Reverse transcriptase domain-containing protein n=1 Tax=Gossypium stocksii TaxID=47602 RepID=A0A9D3W3X1_9ROSI|nr:hypothetical protein J1N35_012312 [Gossypium stocksii]
MEAFQEVLEDCQLVDIGYSGVWFTWERGNLPKMNIRERLDRGVANGKWLSLFPSGSNHHLSYSMSDHCPLLLDTNFGIRHSRNSSFRFEAWWTMEETVEQEIKASWESSKGSLFEKVERLQSNLRRWADAVKKGRNDLKKQLTKDLELLLDKERDDETMAEIINTKVHLNLEIDKDEMYWEQRARANWLQLGDKNSSFFHKFVSVRKKINTISRLEGNEGEEIIREREIEDEATSFFQRLFQSNGIGDLSHLLTGIEPSISLELNLALLSPFTAEEIKSALKGMGPTKVPGYDGFPALFFQKYWHIIGEDVENFYSGILNDDKELGFFNQTNIMLIPKIPNPKHLVNFRPISLCTVIYKIVVKTVANRLQEVIGRCIDNAQSAFVPGRLVTDNVFLA